MIKKGEFPELSGQADGDMTFNQIKYFLTVAECLSFTEAAKPVYHAAGSEPPDRGDGGRTGNPAVSAGQKAAETDAGRKPFIQPLPCDPGLLYPGSL